MLVTSVVLVLEEVVEASLIVATLLAVNAGIGVRRSTVILGASIGLIMALVYGSNMQAVSESFDYVGQEVANAFFQIAVAISIICYSWWAFHSEARYSAIFSATAIAFSLSLEGAEIWIYMSSTLQRNDGISGVILGAALGLGIGCSIGILLYYGISELNSRYQKISSVTLLAFFSGNFLSRATISLTQADWIEPSSRIWDSSDLVSEYSVAGQLLYALIGYEATPLVSQFCAYLLGITAVIAVSVIKIKSSTEGRG